MSNVSIHSAEDQEFKPMLALVPGNIKKAIAESHLGSGSELWKVDPFKIEILPQYNIRERDDAYEAKVQELYESMMNPDMGFRKDTPITVVAMRRGDTNVLGLRAGHRRLEAAKRAINDGAKLTVYAIAVQNSMSEEDMLADLHLSNNGSPISTYELAKLCKLMSVYLDNPSDIAKKLSLRSTQHVERLLMLINGPFQIREYVRKKVISAEFGMSTMETYGDKAIEVIEKSIARSKSLGSKSVSAKHLPGAAIQKAITKSAPIMRDAIVGIRQDPAFVNLHEDTRAKIEEILATLEKAQEQEDKIAQAAQQTTGIRKSRLIASKLGRLENRFHQIEDSEWINKKRF